MVKSKFLIMVALYVILGILVVSNFNHYHHYISVRWSNTVNKTMEIETNENVETFTTKAPQEFQDSQEFQESLTDPNE